VTGCRRWTLWEVRSRLIAAVRRYSATAQTTLNDMPTQTADVQHLEGKHPDGRWRLDPVR